MNFLKGDKTQSQSQNPAGTQQTHSSGGGGGLMGKVNSAFGGGKSSEKNEDLLDKGVDFAQQRMGGGDQSNESAAEQAKDEHISDAIRSQYQKATGKAFPIKDKS